MPDILHPDQGRNFESTLFHQVLQAFGIHKTRMTVYHPQGDGMVEHFNRSLLQLLRCYVDTEDDLERYLPLVLYTYRTTQHSSTGASHLFSLCLGGHLNHHLSVNLLLLTQIPTQLNYKLSLLHCKILSILTFQLVLNNRKFIMIDIPMFVPLLQELQYGYPFRQEVNYSLNGKESGKSWRSKVQQMSKSLMGK